jgi:amino acid transporter
MGILPFPEYFARSTADGIPGPALLLHFVLSAIVIVAVPASQTSLVFSVLYSFSRTWISGMLNMEARPNMC